MNSDSPDAKIELISVLATADAAARTAARGLLDSFGSSDIREKSTQNLVTAADLESERVISEAILAAFPDHALLREETEFTGSLMAEHLWIVDPIDGTNNYAHGIPQFCISIAYAQRGKVQAGVVYDPMRDEMFSAIRGLGAKLNDQPIHVSSPTGLERSIIATGFYYDRGPLMIQTLDAIRRLFEANIRGIRRMGAAALDMTWTACGRFQGFFEYRLSPWDYAAGMLIVEEAGGVCSDSSGKPLDLTSHSAIVSCPEIAADLVRVVGHGDSKGNG